jgi:DNA-binding transcriptional ArsR family regulator
MSAIASATTIPTMSTVHIVLRITSRAVIPGKSRSHIPFTSLSILARGRPVHDPGRCGLAEWGLPTPRLQSESLLAKLSFYMSGPVSLSDPRQLRAIAHPLRLRLLAELRINGPANATTLAADVGQSAALVSYHLRSLGRYGFVEDVQDLARDGRERWWRAVHEGVTWSQSDFLDTPDRAAAAGTLMSEIAERYAEAARQWLADVPNWPSEWVAAADMSDWPLELTADEAMRLRDEIAAMIERYTKTSADPDAKPVRVILYVLPQRRRG